MLVRSFVLLGLCTVGSATLLTKNQNGPSPLCRQTLTNQMDGTGYTADMKIGPFTQKALLDTGSYFTVVESEECPMCKAANYNSRKSLTFRNAINAYAEVTNGEKYADMIKSVSTGTNMGAALRRFWAKGLEAVGRMGRANQNIKMLMYGSGPMIADLGKDNVNMMGCDKLVGEGVPIMEVIQHMSLPLMATNMLTSIVGMGPGPRPEMHQRLHHMLGVDRFTFCFPKNVKHDGVIVWNDHDPSQHGGLTEIDMVGARHWGVRALDMRLDSNGQTSDVVGCKDGCGALLDTGTSMLGVDWMTFMKIREAWSKLSDCSKIHELPSIKFKLAGTHEHVLPPESYVSIVIPCTLNKLGKPMDCGEDPAPHETNVIKRKMPRKPDSTRKPLANPTSLYQHVSHEDRKLVDGVLDETYNFVNNAVNASGTVKQSGGMQCDLMLMNTGLAGGTVGPLIILGLPFFRYYTTTFDVSGEKTDVKRLLSGDNPARVFEDAERIDTGRKVFTRPAGVDCSPFHMENYKTQPSLLVEGQHKSKRIPVIHEKDLQILKERETAKMESRISDLIQNGF